MKIAMMATSKVSFPMDDKSPRLYLSPLKVALDIAEGLSRKGHEVTFFGPKGSHSNIFKTVTAQISPIYENKELLKMKEISDPELQLKDKERMLILFEQYLLSCLFKTHQKEKFDLIHLHVADAGLPLSYLVPSTTPVVYTVHDAIYPWRKEIFQIYQTNNQYFVAISNYQRKKAPDLNWGDTIYNGTKLKYFPFSQEPGDQLLFLGRLLQRKGVSEAIETAITAKRKLSIIGTPNNGVFWEKKIKPYLKRKDIKYIGFVPYEKEYKYYGQSKAVLLPIQWNEPFGLVMIEAMACGTPVVAFRRGSVPEVIKDGETGFIVEPGDISGMVKAVKKIYDMPDEEYQKMRKKCREHVEKHFTVEKMVNGYEQLYEEILERRSI